MQTRAVQPMFICKLSLHLCFTRYSTRKPPFLAFDSIPASVYFATPPGFSSIFQHFLDFPAFSEIFSDFCVQAFSRIFRTTRSISPVGGAPSTTLTANPEDAGRGTHEGVRLVLSGA